jgi:hypothetical protein
MLGRLVTGGTLAALVLACSCSGGAAVGDSCVTSDDCRSDLQCFAQICTQRCELHFDCGEGYLCSDGECEAVDSQIGDSCDRELDCGPGQACQLDSGGGELIASCREDGPGRGTGGECDADEDCRNGTCAIGRCTQLCRSAVDCPLDQACVEIPRLLSSSAPLYRGCLPDTGVLGMDVRTSFPYEALRIPMPSHARSFAVIMSVDQPQIVGAAKLRTPGGEVLYATPFSPEEFRQNPIRYQPRLWVSTLMVPNTPSVDLETGAYDLEVGSFLAAGGVGTAIPKVRVLYQVEEASTFDLNFYFLNLQDHPCAAALGDTLSATTARNDGGFQDSYLPALATIFDQAGLSIGEVRYRDLPTRPDLDALDRSRLGDLLRLGEENTGLNVFFVRSISPVGIQGLAGGQPGPPRTQASRASGVAISVDTICYRDYADLARVTAHTLGQHMGLFNNRAPDGTEDPIPDSTTSDENLMFFGEFGGTTLSAGQQDILRRYPGLQ